MRDKTGKTMNTKNTPDRRTLTVEEVARRLGIGRTAAYDAVRRGEIPTLRIGRRLLIPEDALGRLLLAGSGDASPPSR